MKFKLLFFLLIFIFLSIGCSDDEEKIVPKPTVDRTVLIYMAAENSLNSDSFKNMTAISKGALNSLNGGKLLVYYDRQNSTPELVEVFQHENKIETKVLESYEEHNSASAEVMSRVIDDAFSRYNSKSKGIILWSHADSWLPAERDLWSTRSFGDDRGKRMDIGELKEALIDDFFDFIIFDACLMSSVEVCYELKDKTKFILGSANEIFAEGLPYEDVVKSLFSDTPIKEQLKFICDAFYKYYSTKEKYFESAAISLIDTSKLDELAVFCRSMLQSYSVSILDLDMNQIQTVYYNDDKQPILHDFKDFLDKIIDEEDKIYLEGLLEQVIVYEKHTSKVYVGTLKEPIDIPRYCGMSSYVPTRERGILNYWYLDLDWAQVVYPNGLSN